MGDFVAVDDRFVADVVDFVEVFVAGFVCFVGGTVYQSDDDVADYWLAGTADSVVAFVADAEVVYIVDFEHLVVVVADLAVGCRDDSVGLADTDD